MARKNLEDDEWKWVNEIEEQRRKDEERDMKEQEMEQIDRLNKMNQGHYMGEAKYQIKGFGKGKKIAFKWWNKDMEDYPEMFDD